jgi:hypothetical protein
LEGKVNVERTKAVWLKKLDFPAFFLEQIKKERKDIQ